MYEVSLSFEHINYISLFIYDEVLKKTFFLLDYFSKTIISNDSIKLLLVYLEKEINNIYEKASYSGKSTMPILNTAYKLNIPFIHLGAGIYQLGYGSKSMWFSKSSVKTDSGICNNITKNKVHASSLLANSGFPSPLHGVATTKEESIHLLKQIGSPVVVKPIDGDRGEGVSINITNKNDLFAAFDLAYKYSELKQVIVERQVTGVCHRIFIVNKKLLYVVKRLPKSIKTDGKSSIKELIKKENMKNELLPYWLKSEVFPLDNETIKLLKELGYSLDSIPPENEWIPLRYIESTQDGGRDIDLTNKIHPENIKIALGAAELFGMSVSGVDIITDDISIPWYENGAIINEVNFSPTTGLSNVSKNKMEEYLNNIIEGNGRIPIHVYVGNSGSMKKAIKVQNKFINDGLKCFVTSHNTTLTNDSNLLHLANNTLEKRVKALLMNNNVEMLIIVVETNELFINKSIEFPYVDNIEYLDDELLDIDSKKVIKIKEYNSLNKLFLNS